MKRTETAFTVLIILLLLGSCHEKKDEAAVINNTAIASGNKQYTIGISPLTLQLEYYVSYVQSLRSIANSYNVDLVIIDSLWNTGKQITDIKDLASMGVDAIICSPTDPVALRPVLMQVENNGVPVIIEMTKVEGIYPLVGTNQRSGGKLAGEYAGKWINNNCNGKCDVVILDFPYFQNIIDRVEGFREGLLETAPEANIYACVDTKAKYETASKTMEDLLEINPDIRCVFGINDDSAKGANAAYENLGLPPEEICIIGFDADQGAIKLIRAGRYFKASVAADTDNIAEACLATAIRKIEKELLEDWIEVKDAQFLIDQVNVGLYTE